MSNEITAERDKGAIMESVLLKGDLSKLTPEERGTYYMRVCESVGLNPLTKPFEYITLNTKLTLYAKRDATDQLRTVHGVSVESLEESEREGVYIVTAKVRNKDGRTDMAKGAVNISGLKGDNLANAMMKAETKAKRRATLSLCGLGLLDETEIETIADVKPITNGNGHEPRPEYRPSDPVRPSKDKYVIPAPVKPDGSLDFDTFAVDLEMILDGASNVNEVSMYNRANAKTLRAMQVERPDLFDAIGQKFREMSNVLM